LTTLLCSVLCSRCCRLVSQYCYAIAVSKFRFFGGGAFVKPVDGKQNAYAELKKYKYSLITSPDSLQYASQLGTKVCVFDKKTELAYGIDNMPHRITLAQLMSTAIECVQSPQGFFIMAEGGKIDWACHSNDAATAVKETIEFSKAVQQAMAWYRKYPNETLIIGHCRPRNWWNGVGAVCIRIIQIFRCLQIKHIRM
jgi:alkaline phosphatase